MSRVKAATKVGKKFGGKKEICKGGSSHGLIALADLRQREDRPLSRVIHISILGPEPMKEC